LSISAPGADDHGSAFLAPQRVDGFARQAAEQSKVVAEIGDRVGEVDRLADPEHARAGLDRLADARVDQRRFPARVGADQQDGGRGLDAGDGGVEAVSGGRGDVELGPILTAFVQRRAVLPEQRLGCVDRLHVLKVARNRGDVLRPRPVQASRDVLERLGPGRGLELAFAAHPGAIQAAAEQAVTGVPGLVVNPLLVHFVVDPRQHAHHFAQAARRCGCWSRPRP
jgi:hypothetical protein